MIIGLVPAPSLWRRGHQERLSRDRTRARGTSRGGLSGQIRSKVFLSRSMDVAGGSNRTGVPPRSLTRTARRMGQVLAGERPDSFNVTVRLASCADATPIKAAAAMFPSFLAYVSASRPTRPCMRTANAVRSLVLDKQVRTAAIPVRESDGRRVPTSCSHHRARRRAGRVRHAGDPFWLYILGTDAGRGPTMVVWLTLKYNRRPCTKLENHIRITCDVSVGSIELL